VRATTLLLLLAFPAWAADGGQVLAGGVSDGGTITLAADYGCLLATEPVPVPEAPGVPAGTVLLFPDRVERLNCELLGCQAEVDAWRTAADAGFSWSTSNTVEAGVSILSTLFSIYAASRTARHLSLLP
jgi:hypothetical protein